MDCVQVRKAGEGGRCFLAFDEKEYEMTTFCFVWVRRAYRRADEEATEGRVGGGDEKSVVARPHFLSLHPSLPCICLTRTLVSSRLDDIC